MVGNLQEVERRSTSGLRAWQKEASVIAETLLGLSCLSRNLEHLRGGRCAEGGGEGQ